MGPEGLPVLLILFKNGYHINIFGSHLFPRGGSKVRQGECKGRFKGKSKG